MTVATLLMVPDDFINDEAQEFLGEIRVKLGITCQLPKSLNLSVFTRRVSGWKRGFRLKFAHGLRYLEPFGEHKHKRRIDIINTVAKAGKGVGVGHMSQLCR